MLLVACVTPRPVVHSARRPIGRHNHRRHDRRCVLKLSTHSSPVADEFSDSVAEAIRTAVPELSGVDMVLEKFDRPPATIGQVGLTVKSVIAVGSGKGGVGKSTLATSIALTLQKAGAAVGLLDADVYGPSVPHLLGLSGRPEIQNGKIVPIYAGHMPVMSMGFLVEKDQAVVWRGPMLHGAINQFLKDTYWGALDYLIIDMPPGTGDIALTLSQMLRSAGLSWYARRKRLLCSMRSKPLPCSIKSPSRC